MSLPQLVGLECVICQKGIASIVAGTFCETCGNPVHRKCASARATPANDNDAIRSGEPSYRTNAEIADARCTKCGGDRNSAIAKEVCRERGMPMQADEKAASIVYPVSKLCPGCGSAEFTRVPPQNVVAFDKDRVCSRCNTRYTPPTPLWAAIVFILLGVFFFAGGVGGLLTGRVFGGITTGVIGAAAFSLGIRSLARPGKV